MQWRGERSTKYFHSLAVSHSISLCNFKLGRAWILAELSVSMIAYTEIQWTDTRDLFTYYVSKKGRGFIENA